MQYDANTVDVYAIISREIWRAVSKGDGVVRCHGARPRPMAPNYPVPLGDSPPDRYERMVLRRAVRSFTVWAVSVQENSPEGAASTAASCVRPELSIR